MRKYTRPESSGKGQLTVRAGLSCRSEALSPFSFRATSELMNTQSTFELTLELGVVGMESGLDTAQTSQIRPRQPHRRQEPC